MSRPCSPVAQSAILVIDRVHRPAHDVVTLGQAMAILLADEQVGGAARFLRQVVVPDHVALVVADDELALVGDDADAIGLHMRRADGVGPSPGQSPPLRRGKTTLPSAVR